MARKINFSTNMQHVFNTTLGAVLYTIALYLDESISSPDEAIDAGLIALDKKDNKLKLTEKGKDLIALTVTIPTEEIREIAQEMIELFPVGRKNGTSSLWRGNLTEITKQLSKLITKNSLPYSKEEYIDATKRYIHSFGKNTEYMQTLKYFILKTDPITGDECSQLLNYLENPDSEDLGEFHFDWDKNTI